MTLSPKLTRLAIAMTIATGLSTSAAFAHDGVVHVHPSDPNVSGQEAAYLNDQNEAMAKMMAAMDIKPTGDIERDFVAMMTPHHQGAIDMAKALLKHGKNEHLRRIAQEIIVEQQQELAAMKLAIGDPLPPSQAVATQVAP